jgi:hypothetical protein
MLEPLADLRGDSLGKSLARFSRRHSQRRNLLAEKRWQGFLARKNAGKFCFAGKALARSPCQKIAPATFSCWKIAPANLLAGKNPADLFAGKNRGR